MTAFAVLISVVLINEAMTEVTKPIETTGVESRAPSAQLLATLRTQGEDGLVTARGRLEQLAKELSHLAFFCRYVSEEEKAMLDRDIEAWQAAIDELARKALSQK